MQKIAYQLGMQKALQEENVDQLLKEAQTLGIDVEKLAFGWGGLGGLASKGMGMAAAHPMATKMLGGAALGGATAGLSGGNVGGGMLAGGLGGAALHGMQGKMGQGFNKWLQTGPSGGARNKFMQGFTNA